MISTCIKLLSVVAIVAAVSSCSSSSGSASAGTNVEISIAPSPAISAAMPAGSKTFENDMMDSVTLTKAYLVVSSSTIETTCDISFTAAIDGLLDIIVPSANAHTTSTPTSTGEPYVINILGVDGGLNDIGSLSPPTGDYCGVDIDMFAADEDAIDLPDVGAGEPDMIGKTFYVEGAYTLNDGGIGNISISTGATLINRELLLSALMMISASQLNGSVDLAVNYDRWFDTVDLSLLELGNADELNKVLVNVTDSIHQL